MTLEGKPDDLVGCVADERLLDGDPANLPTAIGRPESAPPSRARARIVGLGATLTGLSLLGGLLLIVLAVIGALSSGLDLTGLIELLLGIVLVATHWGWVHVAEVTASSIEGRHGSQIGAGRDRWLATVEPYTRYEVSTSVAADGSIAIERVRHRPVRSDPRHFTFVRETEWGEVHSGEEPGAAVTERVELLRREAAADTERERRRFELAADAYERARLSQLDQEEETAARRAESEALSEQLNRHLRDPPLDE